MAALSVSSAQPAIPQTSGMLQMFFALLFVLAMLIAAAWLLKRYTVQQKIPGGAIRVVAGAAVGQRERVVLVEIGDTWLVLGVAPGQVSALHTMPKMEASEAEDRKADSGFQTWLRQILEKRNDRS